MYCDGDTADENFKMPLCREARAIRFSLQNGVGWNIASRD